MSAGFNLAVIGAPLKLSCISISASAKVIVSVVVSSLSSAVAGPSRCCRPRFIQLCCPQQRTAPRSSVDSMRLRPKRTSSGIVECFGGFHINRFSHLFLFLRGGLT
ncbi:unnamed protein product [Linum tenue]|uniref:Secreted protein n=1 Tax=Linum tenue TaxID=586396 RepID=A0AAV0NKJ5_9ROSI|nr:unnamed protein product [Linum tenue]